MFDWANVLTEQRPLLTQIFRGNSFQVFDPTVIKLCGMFAMANT